MQFPPSLRRRKEIQSIHYEFQSNVLHSDTSIVYNRAIKIKAYASECKTNLIEFLKFGFNGQIFVQIRSLH